MLYDILMDFYEYIHKLVGQYILVHYYRYKRGYNAEVNEHHAAIIITEFIRYIGNKKKENSAKIIQTNYRAYLERKDYKRKQIAVKVIQNAYKKKQKQESKIETAKPKKSSWW